MKTLHLVAWILLVIGGLNWLLIGLGGWDVVAMIFGMGTTIARLVYILVGLSAIYEIATHKANCRACAMSNSASGSMASSMPR